MLHFGTIGAGGMKSLKKYEAGVKRTTIAVNDSCPWEQDIDESNIEEIRR